MKPRLCTASACLSAAMFLAMCGIWYYTNYVAFDWPAADCLTERHFAVIFEEDRAMLAVDLPLSRGQFARETVAPGLGFRLEWCRDTERLAYFAYVPNWLLFTAILTLPCWWICFRRHRR